ncbi:hypothetical protein GRI75_02570 [Altererythrobacter soli]|uniref:Phosphatase n=1 Tax=Croceibacterium soli TaxID=1739690 RepID=A0A6I4UNH3_9SPHN|nr:protein tyrosine phosphatase family protein [Croceibacterium soli]MXP40530.1 hypothetical protein [Croceibacterium soli]
MENDPDDIRNFLRLSDRVTTSGRLQEGDPARLAAIGVRHVINLAMPGHPEALPDPDAAMAEAGLRYTHIPVPFDAPEEAHYRLFAETLAAEDQPVHVHCVMNWRVSAFFYRWNRERGMDEAEARRRLETIWSPDENDHPDAPKWAAFVRGEA